MAKKDTDEIQNEEEMDENLEELPEEGEELKEDEEIEKNSDEYSEKNDEKSEEIDEEENDEELENGDEKLDNNEKDCEINEEDSNEGEEELEAFEIEDIPGVGSTTAKKLRSAGFEDPMGIATSNPTSLSEVCEIGENTARKIIQAARTHLKMDFISGLEMVEKMKTVEKLTTGSKEFNALLGGGVETQAITEAYGAYGSGKSQLAFQLAINVQLPKEKGGLDGKVVWVDTEGTFRPNRIVQIAKAKELDPQKALENIKVARAFSADHQILLIEKLPELFKKHKNIRLIIVDSLTAIFRSEYVGRGTLAERQQKLNKHVHSLQRLADRYNVAIYVTNQVMSKPDTFFGDPTRAIGGHVLGHACLGGDTFIQLADGKIKRIKDVAKKNRFVTLNKKFQNIDTNSNGCFVRKDIKKVYDITADSKITCSPEHRFFRLEGFEIKEVMAKELKEGDQLLSISNLDVDGTPVELPEIEIEHLVFFPKDKARWIKNQLSSQEFNREQIAGAMNIKPRQLRRVFNQSYPTHASNVDALSFATGYDATELTEPIFTNKHKNVKISNEFNPEICQLLGYFLGDGNIYKNTIEFKDERKNVLLAYKKLIKEASNLDSNLSPVKNKNCYKLRVNNKYFAELMDLISSDYTKLASLPNEMIASFIKGFTDAEGYVSKSRPRVSIAQKNEDILVFIQLLLKRFGIKSCIRKSKRAFIVLIDGREIIKFANHIGVTAPDKKSLLDKWTKHCKNTHTKEIIPLNRKLIWNLLKNEGIYPSKYMRSRPDSYKNIHINELSKIAEIIDKTNIDVKLKNLIKGIINGNIEFTKVRKIKTRNNSEPLYDIDIPKFKKYVANGFVVHNSTYRIYLRHSKGEKRVAKLVDSPCLPEGECAFKITENGLEDLDD